VPGGDPGEYRYVVSLPEFEWHMDRIGEAGLKGVSMRRISECLARGDVVPPDWIALTFDDGNASDHAHAMPSLRSRGYDATFFVCGSRVDADGGLATGMIREMTSDGMHIGAHGMTHRFLTTLDARDEEDEIARSRDRLAEISGEAVDHFAPPGGRYSARTLATLRRLSYRAASTSDFGYNSSEGERFVYKRIPVTVNTSRRRFDDVISGKVLPLVPQYVRGRALTLLRGAVGESAYQRMRVGRGGR
jgi:peptidoglycan/xylan/chitin deacetylase (PgdA/CDA1 family)